MNGTGFLEKDSVVQPCQEHLAVRASRAFLSIECSPGHHPGEKLSPQEGGMTCLRSLHRPAASGQRQSWAENTQPGAYLGAASTAAQQVAACAGPELWKPVSWGLGTGWEVGAQGAGGCSSGGISSGTFQRGPWALGAALGPEDAAGKRFQWLVPQ